MLFVFPLAQVTNLPRHLAQVSPCNEYQRELQRVDEVGN